MQQSGTKMAVYCGAGTDVKFLSVLTDTNLFVHIDGQPRSEFGELILPQFERPNFIPELETNLQNIGWKFHQTHADDSRTYLDSADSTRKLRYYVNTAIKETSRLFTVDDKQKTESLRWGLNCNDTLIVAGYDPPVSVMSCMNTHKRLRFVGSVDTCYTDIPDEYENPRTSFILSMHNDPKVRNRFNEFLMLQTDGTLRSFPTWDAFYKHTERLRRRDRQ